MRFKVDENLPPELAGLLRNEGHHALTVWDQGFRGRSDSDVAEACRRERRARGQPAVEPFAFVYWSSYDTSGEPT